MLVRPIITPMPVLSESVRFPTNSFWISIRFCDEPNEGCRVDRGLQHALDGAQRAGRLVHHVDGVQRGKATGAARRADRDCRRTWFVLLATVSAPVPSDRVKSLSERPVLGAELSSGDRFNLSNTA